jgi:FdhE protein
MRETWDRRIQRASDLMRCDDRACSLLTFYTELLALQKQLYERLRARSQWVPTGALDRDCVIVREAAAACGLLSGIASHAPTRLADEAEWLLAGGKAALDEMLLAYWRRPSDRQFFAKALLQPYGQWLVESGIRPADRYLTRANNRCPLCSGSPQLSILEKSINGDGTDGASRRLLCATCLSQWPFRRVMCVACGEEDERKLAYFHSSSFDHLRVDACDTCKRYLKTVDRTRVGLAVPLVDEVAGAPLDIWACDHGYEKVELNLMGL